MADCARRIGSQGGNTPLIWAAYSGSLDVMRLLLERGADTQVTYKKARAQTPRAPPNPRRPYAARASLFRAIPAPITPR